MKKKQVSRINKEQIKLYSIKEKVQIRLPLTESWETTKYCLF